jgi:curved DNA-binding protein CbpA
MVVTADLYEFLGVASDADPRAIRTAYRHLARMYHPDMGGSSERMAVLNVVWSILGNPRKRQAYDRLRLRPVEPVPPMPASSEKEGTRAATPPPGPASGTVLDFGRYAGWSIGQLAKHDANYLEWLASVPIGRRLRPEVEAYLRGEASRVSPPMQSPARKRRGRFRRR